MLAPNSPLRAAVTALAVPATPAAAVPSANPAPPADEPIHRRAARYAWALLLARIYEVFPLRCPRCGAVMRIIAFITGTAAVRGILIHLGEPITPPTIAPARGPPLWAAMDDAASDAVPADILAPPAPDFVFDQRIAGSQAPGLAATARRGGDSCLPLPTGSLPANLFAPSLQTGLGPRSDEPFAARGRRLTGTNRSQIL